MGNAPLIRLLRFIFRLLFVLLVGGYAAVCLYLDTTAGRVRVASEIAHRLSQQVGARVEIGSARLGLPGHILLSDVRLYDRADSLMLSAATVAGSISIRDLLSSGAVRLRSVALLDGQARIYQQRADTATNIQFFLDAFKSGTEPSRHTDVRVSRLVVRRFAARFDRLDAPSARPGVLDASHLALQDLSLSADLPALTDELLHLRLRSLAFNERSGLTIDNLTGEIWLKDGGVRLEQLEVRMPRSRLSLPALTAEFNRRNIASTLRTSGVLPPAVLATDDLAPLFPAVAQLHATLHLSSAFDVTPQRIVLRGADLVVEHPSAAFRGDLQIDRDGSGLAALIVRSDRLSADVPAVSSSLQTITGKALPDVATRLGGADFQGTLQWRRGAGAEFDGTLATTHGSVSGQAHYTPNALAANLYLNNVGFATIFQSVDFPESLSATIDGKVSMPNGTPHAFDGKVNLVQAVWRGRLVRGMMAEGHAEADVLNLQVVSTDPAASLQGHLVAALAGGKPQEIAWTGTITRFVPSAWGIDAPHDLVVSLDGNVEARGLAALATMEGTAMLNSVQVSGAGMDISQHDLSFDVRRGEGGHDVSFLTPYGDLSLRGPLAPEQLQAAAQSLLVRALPDFAEMFNVSAPVQSLPDSMRWALKANLTDDKLFTEVFRIPLTAPEGLFVEGVLASGNGRTELIVTADTLCYDNQGFGPTDIYLQGEGEEYSLMIQTQKQLAGMPMNLAATAQTMGGKLTTRFSWLDANEAFRGELAAVTMPMGDCGTRMRTVLEPTEVFFKDSVWNVASGTVIWGRDTLAVDRLLVEHEHQHLYVDGAFSEGSPDSITADLQGIDLEYVFDLLKFHPVYFAGIADGHAVLTFADKKPVVRARLDISDFSINNGLLGRADIRGQVDLQSLHIGLDADILDAPHGRTLVTGFVSPPMQELDLNIDSRRTNIEFLRRYISGFLANVSGRATGQARLFGTFKELQLTGDVMADLSGNLPILGCNYQVDSAHVVMTPGLIDIRSGKIRDMADGTAIATGRIEHDYLDDFRYAFGFDLDHLLIYDRQRTSELTFSSHALASGHVTLKGEPGRLDCDLDVRPERGSNFRYHIDLPEDYTSSSLLRIRPAPELESGKMLTADATKNRTESSTDVRMSLNLDMHPDVPLTVIMDEKTGDNIVVRGNGPLRATYYNKGQFSLFGTYTVESGIYKMTIQDIIHKDFHFQEGGTVVFNGKPFDGLMDLQAAYTVPSASLADLNLTGGVSQNGVRVNCLLNFSGQLRDPKVRFDLDMPTVSQDVKQMVRSLISTDEEMNRQVLYLLAIGRFYTYDYAAANGAQSQGETAMNSFLSNTLSGQLNNFIASAMGQSNWTFGTNVSTGNYGWEDVGVEGQIGGRLLNNRLLINGNFGYRNSVTQQSGNFVGDFDVQYLLTPGGGIRLKAYNETNDRYFTKNSLTTQGAGIVLQRSFHKFGDLFRRKKK